MTALAACAAIAPTGAAMADAGGGDRHAPRYLSITIDNDLFVGGDSHYTDGIQVAALLDRQSLPAWLVEGTPIRWSVDPGIMFAVGQRIYTPADTDAVHPDPRDRPYAGWLYLLADLKTRSDAAIDHLSFSVGVIGPASLAGPDQSQAHPPVDSENSPRWGAHHRTEPALVG